MHFFFLRFNFFSASESFFGFKPFFPVSDLLLWFCVVGVYQGVDAAALSHLLQVKNSLHHLSFSGCCWHQPTGTKHSFSYYHIMEYIDKLMFVTYWYTLRLKIKVRYKGVLRGMGDFNFNVIYRNERVILLFLYGVHHSYSLATRIKSLKLEKKKTWKLKKIRLETKKWIWSWKLKTVKKKICMKTKKFIQNKIIHLSFKHIFFQFLNIKT